MRAILDHNHQVPDRQHLHILAKGSQVTVHIISTTQVQNFFITSNNRLNKMQLTLRILPKFIGNPQQLLYVSVVDGDEFVTNFYDELQ